MLPADSSPVGTAAITMNHPTLLRLLLVRELCDLDPAPTLPPVLSIPDVTSVRLGRVTVDVSDRWRSHWQAAVTELGRTAPPAGGVRSAWPSGLPEPDAADLAAWAVHVARPPRGTPLHRHPSHCYYRARENSGRTLPRRLIVLPLDGRFSARESTDIGYISILQYLEPSDELYGFTTD